MNFPGDPLAPHLLELDSEMMEAVATGVVFGQQIVTRAVVPADVARRLRIAVYQGDGRATLALVDGDAVVAATGVSA